MLSLVSRFFSAKLLALITIVIGAPLFLGISSKTNATPDPAEFPGGAGSVRDLTRNAFGHPLVGVSNQERREFFVGNSFFKDVWVQAPSSTEGRDGLGPTFNATSCSACHGLDGRGPAFLEANGKVRVDLSLLFRLSGVTVDGFLGDHPVYGEQLNPFGIKGVPGEGQASVEFTDIPVTYPDGEVATLRRPRYSFANLAFGDLEPHPRARFSPRQAPQVIGLGLIEAIPAADILALEDPQDANGDAISGRANWALDHLTGQKALGRFGWKAGQPTVRQQSAAAFNGDMGLTTSMFPNENCPPLQTACVAAPTGGAPEVTDQQLDRVTLYMQLLAVPARRKPRDPEVLFGEKLFHQVNCATCHTPRFTTGADAPSAMLRNQIIFPYSDFLLHDVGMDLADHRPEAMANGREWRTPPLWGLGMIRTVNGHQNLMHDGRARGVEEAILWHGGEAEASKRAFMGLTAPERKALIEFVNDL